MERLTFSTKIEGYKLRIDFKLHDEVVDTSFMPCYVRVLYRRKLTNFRSVLIPGKYSDISEVPSFIAELEANKIINVVKENPEGKISDLARSYHNRKEGYKSGIHKHLKKVVRQIAINHDNGVPYKESLAYLIEEFNKVYTIQVPEMTN